MLPSPRPPRLPSRLSNSLNRQLSLYVLASGAAGVGVLALAQPAEGKIVYTPAQVILPPGFGTSYHLDLNHDGSNEFSFTNFYSATSQVVNLFVSPAINTGNEIFSHSNFATALPAGVSIGPRKNFPSGSRDMAYVGSFKCYGPWKNAHKRYLGLKFNIRGKTHYGWARLNVNCVYPKAIRATLTGYAYETIPNKSIITGKTKGPDLVTMPLDAGSLGHLALGSK